MALFRQGLPKRAVAGAFVGFLYGILVMPTSGEGWSAVAIGAGWVILSVSLLFGRPLSYYVFLTWAILWIAWKGVLLWREQLGFGGVLDVVVPLVAVALLSSSGYLEMTRAPP